MFDPSLPVNGSEVSSAELRGQFNGLKSLIDAIVPTPGDPGPAGRGIANIRDNGDSTLTIEMTDGSTFGPFPLPPGPAGPPGTDSSTPGPAGADGRSIVNVRDDGLGRALVEMSDGATYGPFIIASGPEGAAGAGISSFEDVGGGSFLIHATDGQVYGPFTAPAGPPGASGPSGADGANGADGAPGSEGAPGPQGPAGDVSAQQLADAVNGAVANSSANTNAVGALDENADQAAIIAKINELINALRR